MVICLRSASTRCSTPALGASLIGESARLVAGPHGCRGAARHRSRRQYSPWPWRLLREVGRQFVDQQRQEPDQDERASGQPGQEAAACERLRTREGGRTGRGRRSAGRARPRARGTGSPRRQRRLRGPSRPLDRGRGPPSRRTGPMPRRQARGGGSRSSPRRIPHWTRRRRGRQLRDPRSGHRWRRPATTSRGRRRSRRPRTSG